MAAVTLAIVHAHCADVRPVPPSSLALRAAFAGSAPCGMAPCGATIIHRRAGYKTVRIRIALAGYPLRCGRAAAVCRLHWSLPRRLPAPNGAHASAMRAAADDIAAPSAAAPQAQAMQRACGLGLTVLPDPDCAGPYPLVITAVSPYSFAKQVGCGLGDVVKRIDGIDTRGMPLPTLFQKLVGAVDSSVVLLLETVNGKQKMVTLRRTIPPPRILRRAEDYSNLAAAYALAGEW
jgi:hypothetical protein